MLIEITNLFGSFKAMIIENLYMGADWAGFRAIVVDSNLPGWPNGEIIEQGTLTNFRTIAE